MEMISQWITHYGYFAIFLLLMLGIVGLPIPDEWVMTFAGYLVFRHDLRLVPAYACAAAGSMCGITVSYGLGRSLGLFILHRYGRLLRIAPGEVEKVHDWFDRFGIWALLTGYFLPGIRHLTAIVAGTSRLRPLLFVVFAYTGALIWSGTFIAVGYFFGERWSQVLDRVHRNLDLIAITAVFLLLVYVFWLYRSRKMRVQR